MSTEIKHHEFSPSRLNQFFVCPGSYIMQKGFPEEPKSPDAEEGTMLHACVASGKTDGLNPEQTAAVTFCLDYLENLMKQRAEEGKKVVQLLFEERLTVYDENGEVLTEGIADVVVIYDDQSADNIDWKFGRGEVTPVSVNYQTAAYSLAIHQRFGCYQVTAHIVQPRLFKYDRYTFDKFPMLQRSIRLCIEAAKSETSIVLRATENGCKYCRAKSICPAFREKFASLVPAESESRDLSNPDILLDWWNKAQIVEKFVGQLKQAVTDYCSEHGRLGDWVLKERSGKKEVPNSVELCQRLNNYISAAEWRSVQTVNLGKLLDILAEKAIQRATAKGEKLTAKKAREDAETMIDDLIQKGKPTQYLTKEKTK